jgi:hypothetical protein
MSSRFTHGFCRLAAGLLLSLFCTQLKSAPPPVWKLSRKGGWMFPIQPGKPASLTGNMGELRSNHFHGGLDIRTGWASGLPVRAAKSGFVSHVSMAGEGYGNTLFVTHPDGFVTVYAHLERISGPLHDFVKKRQYSERNFAVEISLPPGRFPVRQGDTLAVSGNTGSSRGPHLHFEIRDTAGIVYNPLSFGFEEVRDNLSPVIDRLAIVSLEPESRVRGRFGREEIAVREAGKEFHAVETVRVRGSVGLEMKARDRINNGTSNGGIFCIEMYAEGKLVYYHNLSTFPIARTNHVNQLLNYRHFRLSGEKFQRLFCADGYFQTRHTPPGQHGKLSVAPGQVLPLEIWLWDVAGNKRICRLTLRGEEMPEPVSVQGLRPASRITHEVWDNTLLMETDGLSADGSGNMRLFRKGRAEILGPAYREGSRLAYTYDLRKGLPDSAVLQGRARREFSFIRSLTPFQAHTLAVGPATVSFSENGLFDTLHLEGGNDEENRIFQLCSSLTPLPDYFTLGLPRAGSEEGKFRGFAEALSGIFSKSLHTECTAGKHTLTSRYLGRFRLAKDSTGPRIRTGVCNPSGARFNIYDNLSGIESFEATLNGEFILMVWDKKQHLLFSDPWPGQLPMKGEFILKVRDFCGNSSEFRKTL